jgi:site-specific recombinase XerD
MAVPLRKDGRGAFYYRCPDYCQVEEYLGHGSDAEARAYQRDGELGLRKRRPRRDHSGPSFLDLAKDCRDKKDFNENSRYQLRVRLEANLIPHFGHRAAAHFRSAGVDDYVRQRREASVSDATISRELTNLKAILNWSAKHAPPLIPFNPIANYAKPRVRNSVSQPPDPDETRKIIEHAPPHHKRCICIAWFLGLRSGTVELLRLRWNAVRWDRRRNLVISADKGDPEAQGVRIHKELLFELHAWRHEDKAAGIGHIIHYNGQPIPSIKKTWWNTLERAGFRMHGPNGEIDQPLSRRIRPYDLHDCFITQTLDRGADLMALSDIAVNHQKSLLKFYKHVTSAMHEKTVALMAPLMPNPKSRKKPRRPRHPKRDH